MNDQLHVITARFNPLRWQAPDRNFRDWAQHMLDIGVNVTVCELQYGERPFVCDLPHINHIGVRAEGWCWSKENLINIAVNRLPDARYVCWEDADVFHRRGDWAAAVIDALQRYPVVQTWTQCIDFGPKEEVVALHHSLAGLYTQGLPICRDENNPAKAWWKWEGGRYEYAHSGLSWACRREFLDHTDGLFELALIGSGDYHMALAMLGKAELKLFGEVGPLYRNCLMDWQDKATEFLRGRLGVVPGTIEHRFHGRKSDRKYIGRWEMFIQHGFDPSVDMRRNEDGVLEWSGSKPKLELEWERYLRSRIEDANSL